MRQHMFKARHGLTLAMIMFREPCTHSAKALGASGRADRLQLGSKLA